MHTPKIARQFLAVRGPHGRFLFAPFARDHRAFAAIRAISDWRALVNCRARARPPIAASALKAAFIASGLGSDILLPVAFLQA
jgi:hypothetical protein